MVLRDPSTFSPPPGGDQHDGFTLNAFTLWTNIACLIFVILRLVTRLKITRAGLWWDDHFIIVAMLATAIGGSLDACEVHFGFGTHEYYLNEHQIRYFTAYAYGEWIQTFLTLMSTKVSICFLLLRILDGCSRRLARPLDVSIAILILSNIAMTLCWIFQCNPIRGVWDADVPAKCLNRAQLLHIVLAQAVISVWSDFLLALYPILILWKVQMSWKSKIGVWILMGLGVIVGSCCIVRTVLTDASLPTDSTYGGITNWFWRLFEVQLGIICACIPTLVPMYKAVKIRLQSRIDQYNSNPSRRPSVESFMLRVPFFASASRKNSAQTMSGPSEGSERKGSVPPPPPPNLKSNRTERALMGKYAQQLFSKFSYGGGSVIDPNERFEGDLEAQKKHQGLDDKITPTERAAHSGAAGGPTFPKKVHVEPTIDETEDGESDRRALRANNAVEVGRRTSIEVYYSDASSEKSG